MERRKAMPCASICWRSSKQAAAVTKVRLSALRLPSKRGEKLKAQLARRREDEKSWLFESVNRNLKRGASLTSPRSFAGRGRREAPGEGPGTELPKLIGSKGLQRN